VDLRGRSAQLGAARQGYGDDDGGAFFEMKAEQKKTEIAAPCPHVHLKRQNVGEMVHYRCEDCPQKFLVEEWDGKMEVIENAKG
jgi:hypothetical protein